MIIISSPGPSVATGVLPLNSTLVFRTPWSFPWARTLSIADDLKSFSAFFQFDYILNCHNKFKDQTDKFKTIERFFKGETDLTLKMKNL